MCLVIDNKCVPITAIYWIESSVKDNTSGADVLESNKKAYCAGHNIRHNLMLFSFLSVSQVHTNTLS